MRTRSSSGAAVSGGPTAATVAVNDVSRQVGESARERTLTEEETTSDAPVREDAIKATNNISVPATHDGGPKTFPANPLSALRPGYTAPFSLTAPSLDKFKPSGGLESLRKAAMNRDYTASLAKSSETASSVLAVARSKAKRHMYHGMQDPWTDPTLAQDLHLIRHRNYLDPKRFYKNPDLTGKWVQRGTYIDDDARKVRHGTLVDQILGSNQESDYVKRKYRSMQQAHQQKKKKISRRKHN